MYPINAVHNASRGSGFFSRVTRQFRQRKPTVPFLLVEFNRFFQVNRQAAQTGPVDETVPDPPVFMQCLFCDSQSRRRFRGRQEVPNRLFLQHVIQQRFCMVVEGPCSFQGKDQLSTSIAFFIIDTIPFHRSYERILNLQGSAFLDVFSSAFARMHKITYNFLKLLTISRPLRM